MRLMDLFEGASDVLYHYTSIHAAAKILAQGKFELSSTIGSIEEKYAPAGYPYFLSCTRTKVGGYHQMIGHSAVMFNLDGRWVNSRYKAGPVDYWGDRGNIAGYGKDSEAEDRIFSKDPTMPIGGVTAVHVYMEPMTEKDRKSWGTAAPALARKVLLAAKKNGIPAFLYEDKEAWRMQDTRKAVPITKRETLSGQEVTGRGGRSSSWLDPWLELIHKTATNQMSKKAQHLAYSLAYDSHYYMDSTIKSLENDFSNARKPNAGPDREVAVKIIDWMKKNRLNNLRQFVDALAAKWKPIKERENAAPVNEAISYHPAILEQIEEFTLLTNSKNPKLFEDNSSHQKFKELLDRAYVQPIEGKSYYIASIIWNGEIKIANIATDELSHKLIKVTPTHVFFEINGKAQRFPEINSPDTKGIHRTILFNSSNSKKEWFTMMHLSFSDWNISYKSLNNTRFVSETLKKVKGRWALVSRKDPSKVLQYYHGSGHPSKEWVSKVERRVHSFTEEIAPETQRLEVKTSSTGKRTFFEGYLKADADDTPAWLRVVQKPKLVAEATCEIDANGDCYIGHIQAHREYQGFATELVKHVLDYYHDQGVNNFKAYINHENSGSKNVFRKLGFAETGKQRDGSFWTLTI